MKIRAIITGATGMVGKGVLLECLDSPDVESILVINRKSIDLEHSKLSEIIHSDFFNLSSIRGELDGYNACFFCLGTTSVGVSEEEYTKITYDLTINFAKEVLSLNPEMKFCYVSGAGTDSSEKGRTMWARVKGKTENDLMKMPFKATYVFRPGYIHPMPGMKNTLSAYKYMSFLYPVFKILFPKFICSLSDIGTSMIEVCRNGYSKKVLECKDIALLGNQN